VACFTDAMGRRLKLSTKIVACAANRRKAMEVANHWEDAARNRIAAARVVAVAAELSRAVDPSRSRAKNVREAAEFWLRERRAETAAGTGAIYEGALAKFLAFLGPKAEEEIGWVERADVSAFRDSLAGEFGRATVNRDLKVIRMFFRSARRDRMIVEDPAEFVKTIRRRGDETKRRRPFSEDELEKVLAHADEEWRNMILVGLYTGARLGDVAALTWDQVEVSGAEVALTFDQKKTGRRIVLRLRKKSPLRDLLLAMAKSPRSAGGPLHPRAFGIVSRQGKVSNLSNQFADLLALAGLRAKQGHRATHGAGRGRGSAAAELSFHSLRHSAVSYLKRAGIPDAVVKELVGHESNAMSDHYTTVGAEAIDEAAAAFPAFDGLPVAPPSRWEVVKVVPKSAPEESPQSVKPKPKERTKP
jgi:integrase